METSSPALEHADDFLRTIDVAAKTGETYRHGLRAFAEFLSGNGQPVDNIIPLSRLREDSLAGFRQWMRQERQYSRRTEGTYLAALVRFVEWLDANSCLPVPLTSSRMKLILKGTRGRRRTGYPTQPIKDAVPLIVEYYDRLALPASSSPRAQRQRLSILRNRAMIHTLFATGLRAQELASLRRSDCDNGQADKMRIVGKGGKERVVMLNAEAQAAIRAYLHARDEENKAKPTAHATRLKGEPLFVRHDRDRLTPISTKTVWQVVRQAARALGLLDSISPHDFRRYLATALLSEGMPLESVQAFLGHESIVTTRTVYAHTTWSEVLDDQVRTYRPSPTQAVKRARRKVLG